MAASVQYTFASWSGLHDGIKLEFLRGESIVFFGPLCPFPDDDGRNVVLGSRRSGNKAVVVVVLLLLLIILILLLLLVRASLSLCLWTSSSASSV